MCRVFYVVFTFHANVKGGDKYWGVATETLLIQGFNESWLTWLIDTIGHWLSAAQDAAVTVRRCCRQRWTQVEAKLNSLLLLEARKPKRLKSRVRHQPWCDTLGVTGRNTKDRKTPEIQVTVSVFIYKRTLWIHFNTSCPTWDQIWL